MKKIVLFAAVAALSACSQKADKSADTMDDAAAKAASAVPADRVGTFDIKSSDGTTSTTVISANGLYVVTATDGQTHQGMFAVKDGKDCFDPEGSEAELCWSVTTRNADGSFVAQSPDGQSATITPKKANIGT